MLLRRLLKTRSETFKSNPIFIGGDGRSGTTLLSVMLDSHPDLVVGPELHFNGPKNLGPEILECLELLINNDPRAFGKGLKENLQFKLGVQFAKRCHRFGIEFTELHALVRGAMRKTDSELSRFEHRCVLIDAIGERNRKRRKKRGWGIKVMREIRHIRAYADLWPQARFIHLIRDGRDVAASQLKEHGTWGYNQIQDAARGWVDLIKKTRANGGDFRVLETRYEDLVLRTEKTVRKILDFLGLPWSGQVLHHTDVDHSLFYNPYNHPSIDSVTQPVNDSAIGRHRRDLTQTQIASFNKIAGDYLREFEYPLDGGCDQG